MTGPGQYDPSPSSSDRPDGSDPREATAVRSVLASALAGEPPPQVSPLGVIAQARAGRRRRVRAVGIGGGLVAAAALTVTALTVLDRPARSTATQSQAVAAAAPAARSDAPAGDAAGGGAAPGASGTAMSGQAETAAAPAVPTVDPASAVPTFDPAAAAASAAVGPCAASVATISAGLSAASAAGVPVQPRPLTSCPSGVTGFELVSGDGLVLIVAVHGPGSDPGTSDARAGSAQAVVTVTALGGAVTPAVEAQVASQVAASLG